MDMVERVAMAICEASGETWRTGTYPLATGKNFEWEDHDADKLNNHWRFKARAAIEAMREPDEAFLERLAERAHDGRFSKSGELYPVYRNFLRAFFDAALGDQP